MSEGVKRLQSGEQWTSTLEYTIIAWGYVQVSRVTIQGTMDFNTRIYNHSLGICTGKQGYYPGNNGLQH